MERILCAAFIDKPAGSLHVCGANACGGCVRVEFYLLDENNDMELVKEEFFTSEKFNIRLKIRSYETYMMKFKQDA